MTSLDNALPAFDFEAIDMHYPLEHDLSFDLDLLQSGSGITLLQDLSNYEIHQADVWKTSELSDGESTGSSSASAPSKTGKVAKARTKYTHSLSDSDRELLREEGYSIPEIMTKDDEKVLRQLRRKIKNKMIASDARKRNKEYVSSLEERVDMMAKENQHLAGAVTGLEQQNRSLLQQLMDLRASLGQPATLLVLALAFSFVFVPANTTDPGALAHAGSSATASWLNVASWVAAADPLGNTSLDMAAVPRARSLLLQDVPAYRSARTL